MTEEVIKEIITSTLPSAEQKCEDHTTTITDGNPPPGLKRKEKPVPHYLRPSSSSCHDNCKFGIQHSSESKKYQPIRRAQLRRASTGNVERDRVEIFLPQRSRTRKDQNQTISHVKDGTATPTKPGFSKPKAPLERASDHPEMSPCTVDLPDEASEPVVDRSLPTDAECCIISQGDMAHSEDGESSDGAVSIELEMPLAIQDSDASDEHIEDVILSTKDLCKAGEQSLLYHVFDQSPNECAGSEKRAPLIVMTTAEHEQDDHGTKPKGSPKEPAKPKAKVTSSNMNRNSASTKTSGRISHLKATGEDALRSNGSKAMRKIADATATASTKSSRSEKKLSPTAVSTVQKAKEVKVPSPASATDSSTKPAKMPKPKASVVKNAASSSLLSGKQTDRKITLKDVTKNAQVLQKKGVEKAIPRPVKLSRSVNMPAKSLLSIRLRTVKKDKIAVPIKTDNTVPGTANSTADAKEKIAKTVSTKVRKPAVNNHESRSRKEKSETPITATTARRPKPTLITPSAAAPPQPPRKLTFRRGKVVTPDEGGGGGGTPRLLRFRPAKAGASGGSSRGGRATGRQRGGGAAAAARDAAGAPRAEVVVLRRRRHDDGGGGDGRKQGQVLLNNVIEETASRLVAEARKSKVKALVGAFESVISLQEGGGKAAAPAAAAVAP
ncbi:hypothetical protein ACP4OV_022848 [Aristida adscensionis]